MTSPAIRTLVVEDDALTAQAHADYLGRIEGFELAGVARTATEALAAIRASLTGPPIDLVLLDLTLPDGHGLELARRMRSAGVAVDIVAITAVRETETVRTAISVGIVQYLIKPFSFAVFRDRLESYRSYRLRLESSGSAATQEEVDGMLATLRPSGQAALPKGLSGDTLAAVVAHLKRTRAAVSSGEVAESLDLSRVTARRYLEHLADVGQATRSPRYGTPGRPELEYLWAV
jgi:response regulator of citrate/malate metabolism